MKFEKAKRSRWSIFVALGLLAASASGCAYFAAEAARAQVVTQELDGYVIAKPLDVVWEKATTVHGEYDELTWSGQGFTWREIGPHRMRTNSKKDSTKPDSFGEHTVTLKWFEAEGAAVGQGSQVRYFEVTDATTYRKKERVRGDQSRTRRTDLELELVKQFDPARAKQIAAKGEAAAQKELQD